MMVSTMKVQAGMEWKLDTSFMLRKLGLEEVSEDEEEEPEPEPYRAPLSVLDNVPGVASLTPKVLNRALTYVEMCAGHLELVFKVNEVQLLTSKEQLKISKEQPETSKEILKTSNKLLDISKEILNQEVVLARMIACCKSDAQKGCAALGLDLRKLVSIGKSLLKQMAIPLDGEGVPETSDGGERKDPV
jgi:hypothetical protein